MTKNKDNNASIKKATDILKAVPFKKVIQMPSPKINRLLDILTIPLIFKLFSASK